MKDYEQLQSVFTAAIEQASQGKGKERHANGLPFHEQRMQKISTLLDSPDGMAFQVAKKMTEGLQFDCPERREAELLGAMVYLAGMVVWLRNREDKQPTLASLEVPGEAVDWDEAEKRMDAIGQNGPTAEHYREELEGLKYPPIAWANWVAANPCGTLIAFTQKPAYDEDRGWISDGRHHYIPGMTSAGPRLYHRRGKKWFREIPD